MKNKWLRLIAAMMCISMIFCACGSTPASSAESESPASSEGSAPESSSAEGEAAEDTSLQDIKDKGVLVVGMNASFAPCEFHMMIDGVDTIVGFDMDLAKEVAKDMGVELQIQEMEFAALITSLVSGQVDVVISGLAETEERRQSIDFSIPYYRDENVPIIRVEDADKYTSLESLQDKRIGIEMNTVEQPIAEDQLPDAEHVIMESWSALQLALKAGQIDALLSSGLTAQIAVARNPDLMIAATPDGEHLVLDDTVINYKGSGIGVRKGSDALVEQLNSTITRLQESGELDRFVEEACALAAQVEE